MQNGTHGGVPFSCCSYFFEQLVVVGGGNGGRAAGKILHPGSLAESEVKYALRDFSVILWYILYST